MSASNKKKLRKEQNAAALTEKQQKELKEAKKLKNYTMTFVVVMVLVVAIVAGILVRTPIESALQRNTDAVTIGDHTLSSAQLNYYYIDAINDFYNEYYSSYGNYASLYIQLYEGLSLSTPLDEQTKKTEDGEITWADYFVNEAIDNAKSVYALYDHALSENYKITEDEQKKIDKLLDNMEAAATFYGYSNATKYLQMSYGPGAEDETYLEYYKVNVTATSFYQSHADSLEYVDKDYREFEKDKINDYTSYSYSSYYMSKSAYLTFLKLGSPDPNNKDKTVYTDEENKKALDAALKDAESIRDGGYNEKITFDKAIKSLAINKDKKDSEVSITDADDVLYTRLTNEEIKKWLSDKDRKVGDVTIIPNTTTSKDADGKETEVTNGYYVILMEGVNDNTMLLQNVRHILIAFEGGKTNSTTGLKEYTDAEKKKAKEEAEKLMAEWMGGKQTEERFAELANKNSDDGDGTTGGLYEDIYPGQMVEKFEDWCYDEKRTEGEVGIIETEYGYHIMYYVGESDINFRDYMIKLELVDRDTKAWHEDLQKEYTVTRLNLGYLEMDYIMG